MIMLVFIKEIENVEKIIYKLLCENLIIKNPDRKYILKGDEFLV
jgi:hypothetical protein